VQTGDFSRVKPMKKNKKKKFQSSIKVKPARGIESGSEGENQFKSIKQINRFKLTL